MDIYILVAWFNSWGLTSQSHFFLLSLHIHRPCSILLWKQNEKKKTCSVHVYGGAYAVVVGFTRSEFQVKAPYWKYVCIASIPILKEKKIHRKYFQSYVLISKFWVIDVNYTLSFSCFFLFSFGCGQKQWAIRQIECKVVRDERETNGYHIEYLNIICVGVHNFCFS